MKRNTWYCTVITATYMFSNCIFSEHTCLLISHWQCWWRYPFRSKIVDQSKEILSIVQLLLLLTCFPAVFSERTCVLISVGHCWPRYWFRSKIFDKWKEIPGIMHSSLLHTCFLIVYFQSVPTCSSLSDKSW